MRTAESLGALRCPHCGLPLARDGAASLHCAGGHCLNVNRKGIVNLLSRPHPTSYDAGLFSARTRVLEAVYQPAAGVVDRLLRQRGARRILDAGCGEGWYLHQLMQCDPQRLCAGVDISADAIRQASQWPEPILWCVADLRRLPFLPGSFDAVLDILSPAAYDAFREALTPDGVLLKIYPGGEYLLEMRQARGLGPYADGEVESWLRGRAEIVCEERIFFRHPMTEALWWDFVRMTPLNQDLSEAEREALSGNMPAQLTVDLRAAVCRMR